MYCRPQGLSGAMAGEMMRSSSAASHRAHNRLLADTVLDDGKVSGYCSCYPVNLYVAGSRVMKEFTFGEMKVRLGSSI